MAIIVVVYSCIIYKLQLNFEGLRFVWYASSLFVKFNDGVPCTIDEYADTTIPTRGTRNALPRNSKLGAETQRLVQFSPHLLCQLS